MSPANHQLGRARALKPDAQGPPGKRRFRLLVEAQGGKAVLWMEKEQLFNLAMAAKRALATTARRASLPTEEEALPGESLDLECQAAQLFLSAAKGGGLFLLSARSLPASGDKEPITVTVETTADQLQAMADEALAVCAAGRPLCPLCGVPLEGSGHTCIRINGHFSASPS